MKTGYLVVLSVFCEHVVALHACSCDLVAESIRPASWMQPAHVEQMGLERLECSRHTALSTTPSSDHLRDWMGQTLAWDPPSLCCTLPTCLQVSVSA